MGWIDENGAIGYYFDKGGICEENPRGKWITIDIFTAICVDCGIEYEIITEIGKGLPRGAMEKTTAIVIREVHVEDGMVAGHKLYRVETKCKSCRNPLITTSQLAERARFTTCSRIAGLGPSDTENHVIKCSYCGKNEWKYHREIRFDP